MVSVPEDGRRSELLAPESVVAVRAVITSLIGSAAAGAGAAVRRNPVGGHTKRLLDVVVAAAMLMVLAPLMLAGAAFAKLLIGSALVGERRAGFGGKPFTMLMFNTEQTDNPRAACLTNVLRQSGLDTLPQLINVLKGDMSLVGPQPALPEEVARSGRHSRHYCSARPGMIGLWPDAGSSAENLTARAPRDRLYASKWSLGLDLALLFKAAATPRTLKHD